MKLANGKYELILNKNKEYPIKCLRYGEEWRELVGDNLIYFLWFELNEARKHILKEPYSFSLIENMVKNIEEPTKHLAEIYIKDLLEEKDLIDKIFNSKQTFNLLYLLDCTDLSYCDNIQLFNKGLKSNDIRIRWLCIERIVSIKEQKFFYILEEHKDEDANIMSYIDSIIHPCY